MRRGHAPCFYSTHYCQQYLLEGFTPFYNCNSTRVTLCADLVRFYTVSVRIMCLLSYVPRYLCLHVVVKKWIPNILYSFTAFVRMPNMLSYCFRIMIFSCLVHRVHAHIIFSSQQARKNDSKLTFHQHRFHNKNYVCIFHNNMRVRICTSDVKNHRQ